MHVILALEYTFVTNAPIISAAGQSGGSALCWMLISLVIHPSVVGDSQRYAYSPFIACMMARGRFPHHPCTHLAHTTNMLMQTLAFRVQASVGALRVRVQG